MATNLEYIFRLKDLYSRKLASITKQQIKFTEQYRRTIGKVNAASVKHQQLLKRTAQSYNINKQAMNRVNQQLEILTRKQGKYAREATRHISRLNMEWRKHGAVVQQAQKRSMRGKRGMGGVGLSGMAGGIGASFMAKGMIEDTAQFYRNLNMIEAVRSEGIDIELMKQRSLEWGATTPFDHIQISGAMAKAAKDGQKQNEILQSIPGNISLAVAGEMDLIEAITLSTDVVKQYGQTVSNVQIANELAAGASAATSDIRQLGAALQNVGSIAHQAAISSRETIMVLMAMGETGLRGEIGGTYLVNLIMRMKQMKGNMQKGMRGFLKGTGVGISEIFNLKTGTFTDMEKFLRMIINASQEQVNALTKAAGMRAAKALGSLSQLSTDRLDEFIRVLDKSEGQVARMQEIIMQGLPGGLVLLSSAWKVAKYYMLESFIEPLSLGMRWIAEFLRKIYKFHKWILTLAGGTILLMSVITTLGIAAWIVVGSFTALGTVGMALWTVLKGVWWITKLSNLQLVLYRAMLIGVSVASVIAAVTMKILRGALWLLTFAFKSTYIKMAVLKTGLILLTAWQKRAAISSGLLTIATWLFSAALWANPITWVVALVIALAAAFVYAWVKLGSFTEAIKFVGIMLIRALMEPANLVINMIRGLLYVLALLPNSVGGDMFGRMKDDITKMQKTTMKFASGSDRSSIFQVGYDFVKKGADSSEYLSSSSYEAAVQRKKEAMQIKLDINTAVKADPGTEVTQFDWIAETFGGLNLGPSMGTN